jgi:hypothetical protein
MSTGPSGRRLSHFTPGLRENEYGRVLTSVASAFNVLAIVVVDLRNSALRSAALITRSKPWLLVERGRGQERLS